MLLILQTDGWLSNEDLRPFVRDDGTSKASDAIIKVAGITGRIRGMKYKRADGRTVRLALLDGDQVDRKHVAGLERQEGAVEGELVQVAERASVGLEVLEVVAGLEIDEAFVGMEPVKPRLARDAAVVAADDALGHTLPYLRSDQ